MYHDQNEMWKKTNNGTNNCQIKKDSERSEKRKITCTWEYLKQKSSKKLKGKENKIRIP